MSIRHFVFSCLASIAFTAMAAVSAALYLPMLATEAIASVRWDWPEDARTRLAIDAISRRAVAVIDSARSTFRSFVARALTHDLYSSGKFDPGRTPA